MRWGPGGPGPLGSGRGPHGLDGAAAVPGQRGTGLPGPFALRASSEPAPQAGHGYCGAMMGDDHTGRSRSAQLAALLAAVACTHAAAALAHLGSVPREPGLPIAGLSPEVSAMSVPGQPGTGLPEPFALQASSGPAPQAGHGYCGATTGDDRT